MITRPFAVGWLLLLALGGPGSLPWDSTRAMRNYQDLLSGRRQLVDLSPAERQELIELDKWLRSTPAPKETESERCWRQELNRVESPPTDLAARLIDLKCGKRPEAR